MSKLRLATILLALLFISCPLITQAAPTPLELPGLAVQQSATVQLGSGIGEAVVFKARNESSRTKPWVQGIARWDEAAKGWQVLHQSHYYFDAVVNYQVVALLPGRVEQVILTQRSGSGGFLSYDVIGAAEGKLQTLLSRSQIFLGRVRVRKNMLIEDNGDLATAWVWQGDRFVSRAFTEPLPVLRDGDRLVRYGIDASGMAWVEEASVRLRPGARLYLRREAGGAVARTLYGGNQVVEHDGKSYLAKTAGVTEIIIIPGGYEHDKAKKIDVEVRE